jgi:hypothetical protein
VGGGKRTVTTTGKALEIALLLLAGGVIPAFAAPAANQCVHLNTGWATSQTGNRFPVGTFRDNCDRDLNIAFCVDNSQSQYSCQSTNGGIVSVAPKHFVDIPGFSNAAGQVNFGACFSPNYPANWHRADEGYHFDCQNPDDNSAAANLPAPSPQTTGAPLSVKQRRNAMRQFGFQLQSPCVFAVLNVGTVRFDNSTVISRDNISIKIEGQNVFTSDGTHGNISIGIPTSAANEPVVDSFLRAIRQERDICAN